MLAVVVGLKVPQAAAGVQLQFTPPGAVSLSTLAATLAVPPAPSTPGGIVISVTTIAGGGGVTDVLPPPQPEIVATTLIARRDKFLFMAPLQSGNARFNAGTRTSIAKPDAKGCVISENAS